MVNIENLLDNTIKLHFRDTSIILDFKVAKRRKISTGDIITYVASPKDLSMPEVRIDLFYKNKDAYKILKYKFIGGRNYGDCKGTGIPEFMKESNFKVFKRGCRASYCSMAYPSVSYTFTTNR